MLFWETSKKVVIASDKVLRKKRSERHHGCHSERSEESNKVVAASDKILRQLLLRCSTSCIHAVVAKNAQDDTQAVILNVVKNLGWWLSASDKILRQLLLRCSTSCIHAVVAKNSGCHSAVCHSDDRKNLIPLNSK
jgi:hypothetical protein